MSKPKRDPDYALKVEHAIAEKYGTETVKHPQRDWTPQKEEDYLEQLKLLNKKLDKISEKLEKVEVQGVLLPKNYLIKIAIGLVLYVKLIPLIQGIMCI